MPGPQVQRFVAERRIRPDEAQRQPGLGGQNRYQWPIDALLPRTSRRAVPGWCLKAPHVRRVVRLHRPVQGDHAGSCRRTSPGRSLNPPGRGAYEVAGDGGRVDAAKGQGGRRVRQPLKGARTGHLPPGDQDGRHHEEAGDQRAVAGDGRERGQADRAERQGRQAERLRGSLPRQRRLRVRADELRAAVGGLVVLADQLAERAAVVVGGGQLGGEQDRVALPRQPPEPLVVLVPVRPGRVELDQVIELAREDRVGGDGRLATTGAEVLRGHPVGPRHPRRLRGHHVVVDEPAPERVVDRPDPTRHQAAALPVEQRDRPSEPAAVDHDVGVGERDHVSPRLPDPLVPLDVRVATTGGLLLLDHHQARVPDIGQGLPGGVVHVADEDQLAQRRIVLAEERLHRRADRPLRALARDHDADRRQHLGQSRLDHRLRFVSALAAHEHQQVRREVVHRGEDRRQHHVGDDVLHPGPHKQRVGRQVDDRHEQLLRVELPRRGPESGRPVPPGHVSIEQVRQLDREECLRGIRPVGPDVRVPHERDLQREPRDKDEAADQGEEGKSKTVAVPSHVLFHLFGECLDPGPRAAGSCWGSPRDTVGD
jgi:hypothetical protein